MQEGFFLWMDKLIEGFDYVEFEIGNIIIKKLIVNSMLMIISFKG